MNARPVLRLRPRALFLAQLAQSVQPLDRSVSRHAQAALQAPLLRVLASPRAKTVQLVRLLAALDLAAAHHAQLAVRRASPVRALATPALLVSSLVALATSHALLAWLGRSLQAQVPLAARLARQALRRALLARILVFHARSASLRPVLRTLRAALVQQAFSPIALARFLACLAPLALPSL